LGGKKRGEENSVLKSGNLAQGKLFQNSGGKKEGAIRLDIWGKNRDVLLQWGRKKERSKSRKCRLSVYGRTKAGKREKDWCNSRIMKTGGGKFLEQQKTMSTRMVGRNSKTVKGWCVEGGWGRSVKGIDEKGKRGKKPLKRSG